MEMCLGWGGANREALVLDARARFSRCAEKPAFRFV